MTPEAAVEAARMTFLLYADDEIVENDAKGNLSRAATRAILEAAAPHMLAEAKAVGWDEGCADGGWNENPYRPTP